MGVKMRIYVFLQQCMHFCIFPGFQLSHLWGFYKSSCFCNVSTRNDTPGPPPLLVQWYSPAAMARVFINPGAIEAKKGCKSKYHRDMGYGVEMRIYVIFGTMYAFVYFSWFPTFPSLGIL